MSYGKRVIAFCIKGLLLVLCGSGSVSGVLLEEQEFLLERGRAGPGAHRDVLPSLGAACGNGPCPEGFYSSPDGTLLVKKLPY